MFQQTLFKKILPCVPKYSWLVRVSQISNDSMKDETSNCEASNTNQFHEDTSQCSYKTREVLHLLEKAATFNGVKDKNWMTTPYPKDIPINFEEETKPSIDPKNTSVLLFPGQGIIKVGMIKKYMNYPAAKELFEIANEIINYDLLKLCLNGPQNQLNRTEFNQAATVISSLVALEKIRAETPKVFENCVATAGYSVGEITALILSGIITFEDGIRLAWTRGKAMQYASDKVPQGMLSVFNTSKAKVSKACTEAENWIRDMGIENPTCRTAIFLCTERKIIAGNIEALEYIEKNKTRFGLTNTSRLPVSGAFHTPLMEPALNAVYKILNSIEINEPRCTVYSNYKAVPYTNLQYVKKYILKQIVSPVRWEQCLQHIYNRPDGVPFPQTYDIGSNGRMKTILNLVNLKASRSCIVI
ncbi:probable malonyl-CoA-acyl carrier protein transacylase, mitochondrial [Bombus pascuorum]|uniref:probable malonyl-CoA-acyl carrier protein transacylase, mitochondrial n=1 Tax=Bombus pascuorum TaxID=65598 RepID=UPI0021249F9E|nr:probable malonyl-CoA-acyl carrier protein transacylase, mitochondrial [Bombus pascuorum]